MISALAIAIGVGLLVLAVALVWLNHDDEAPP